MIIFNTRLTGKNLKTLLIVILLNISLATVALPPDMQADRYLVQVEKALKGKYKDYNKATEIMDKIMALKDQHNLELPIEFYFKYAKVLLKTYRYKQKGNKSFTAINHYLSTAGKSGANYAEALGLYDESIIYRLGEVKTVNEIKQLIELGADVNSQYINKFGTPLRYAAEINNLEGVKILIEAGANATDIHLDWETNPKILKILIQAGTDIDRSAPYEPSPLQWAIFYSKGEIVYIKNMISAGADVNKILEGSGVLQGTPLQFLERNRYISSSDKAKVKRWLKNPSLLR